MSSIGAVSSSASYATLAGLASSGGGQEAALERRLGVLQQQCADVAGCTTTPSADKLKQQGVLNEQIATVRSQLSSLQGDSAPTASPAVASTGGLRNQIDIRV